MPRMSLTYKRWIINTCPLTKCQIELFCAPFGGRDFRLAHVTHSSRWPSYTTGSNYGFFLNFKALFFFLHSHLFLWVHIPHLTTVGGCFKCAGDPCLAVGIWMVPWKADLELCWLSKRPINCWSSLDCQVGNHPWPRNTPVLECCKSFTKIHPTSPRRNASLQPGGATWLSTPAGWEESRFDSSIPRLSTNHWHSRFGLQASFLPSTISSISNSHFSWFCEANYLDASLWTNPVMATSIHFTICIHVKPFRLLFKQFFYWACLSFSLLLEIQLFVCIPYISPTDPQKEDKHVCLVFNRKTIFHQKTPQCVDHGRSCVLVCFRGWRAEKGFLVEELWVC